MSTQTWPAFSIIIPTLGQRASLKDLVTSLIQQPYKGQIEIIVVVNTRRTSFLIRQLKKQFTSQAVRYVVESKAGPSLARNTGFKRARFKQMIFLDDDMSVGSGYLRASAQAWRHHPQAKLIGGQIKLTKSLVHRIPRDWWQEYPWIFVKSTFGSKARKLVLMQSHYSAQLQYRRETGEKIGPFNAHLGNYTGSEPIGGEDYELSQRLLLQGAEIWYCPEIVATHLDSHRYTFGDIMSRQWQAGREIYLAEKYLCADFPIFQFHTFRLIALDALHEFIKMIWHRRWPTWKTTQWFGWAFYTRYFLCHLTG